MSRTRRRVRLPACASCPDAGADGGRSQFNFSEWDKPQDVSIGDLADSIRGGSMPPWFYVIPHPSANFSAAEKDALSAG